MNLHRLHLLPGAIFLLILLTFVATYIIAVLNEHVKPDFPYISDTGTVAPESCIFAQFINFAAFLLVLCVYVRYLQIEEVTRTVTVGSVLLPSWCNKAASVFGYLACLGLDIVANFQETNVLVVHMLGAFICFVSGTIFFIFQTFISRRLMKRITSPCAFYFRVIASVMCILLCISTVVPAMLAMAKIDEDAEKLHWSKEDGGWTLHLVSTISEWALVFCFCTFIASFSGEFYGITIRGPILKLPEPKRFEAV